MQLKLRTKIFLSFLLAALAFSISCSDDDMQGSAKSRKGNYFPTTFGSHWTYEFETSCEVPNETNTCIETRIAQPLHESLDWDGGYRRFEGAALMLQFVKVSGSEYFATGFYFNEYKFLDDKLPAGSTWGIEESSDFPGYFDRFKIRETNSVKRVKGKNYYNVIVVEQTTSYGGDHPVIRNINYFAQGIGHIYRRQTVSYKNGETQTTEIHLRDYFIVPQ